MPIGVPLTKIVVTALPPAGYAYSSAAPVRSVVHTSLSVLVNANDTAWTESLSGVVRIGLPSEPVFGGL